MISQTSIRLIRARFRDAIEHAADRREAIETAFRETFGLGVEDALASEPEIARAYLDALASI